MNEANNWPLVANISATARRCEAESVGVSEKALRPWVKEGAFPTVPVGWFRFIIPHIQAPGRRGGLRGGVHIPHHAAHQEAAHEGPVRIQMVLLAAPGGRRVEEGPKQDRADAVHGQRRGDPGGGVLRGR